VVLVKVELNEEFEEFETRDVSFGKGRIVEFTNFEEDSVSSRFRDMRDLVEWRSGSLMRWW
jgi:hypothetical protein